MTWIIRILSSDVTNLRILDLILVSVVFIAFMIAVLIYFAIGMLKYQHGQNVLPDSKASTPLQKCAAKNGEYRAETSIVADPSSHQIAPRKI